MKLIIQRRAASDDISRAYSDSGRDRFWMDCYKAPASARNVVYEGPDAEREALYTLAAHRKTHPHNEYRIVAVVEEVPATLRIAE